MKSWLGNILCLLVSELILVLGTVIGWFDFTPGTKQDGATWIVVGICMLLILLMWFMNVVYYGKYHRTAEYDDRRFRSQTTWSIVQLVIALLIFVAIIIIQQVDPKALIGLLSDLIGNNGLKKIGNQLYALMGTSFLLMFLVYFFMACGITCEGRRGWIWETLNKGAHD